MKLLLFWFGRALPSITGAGCLIALVLYYGRFFQDFSPDLVAHYVLTDELLRHATVQPDAEPWMGVMALYPPLSHALAAAIGYAAGSVYAGISIATIAALYCAYLLLLLLLPSTRATVLFVVAFLALAWTRSLLGFEVHKNFFYPQLVADVAYLAVLVWAVRERSVWLQVAVFSAVGCLSMWIQPLVALHVLACGCLLSALRSLRAAAVAGVVAATIVAIHPAMQVMRFISGNDGSLGFGYPHVLTVALACGLIGVANLRIIGRERVLGSAAIVGAILVLMQFAAWNFSIGGSPYAVKKHMFLVFTFGVMNLVLIVSRWMRQTRESQVAAPVGAALLCLPMLSTYASPIAPALAADRSATAIKLSSPERDVVFYDKNIPLMSSVIISLVDFHAPQQAANGWLSGADVLANNRYVIVPAGYAGTCPRFGAHGDYVLATTECVKAARSLSANSSRP